MVRINRVYQDAALRLLWIGCIVAVVVGFICLMIFWNPTFFSRQNAAAPAGTASPTAIEPTDATTPSAATAKPTLPAAAKEFSKAGGAMFFYYFERVLQYTYETEDTQLLKEISLPGNVFTDRATRRLESQTGLGNERVEQLRMIKYAFIPSKFKIIADAELRTFFQVEGERKSTKPVSVQFQAEWQNNRWQVKDLLLVQRETGSR